MRGGFPMKNTADRALSSLKLISADSSNFAIYSRKASSAKFGRFSLRYFSFCQVLRFSATAFGSVWTEITGFGEGDGESNSLSSLKFTDPPTKIGPKKSL